MENSTLKKNRKAIIDSNGLYKISILKRFLRGVQINTTYYGRIEFGTFYTQDNRIFCANKLEDESYILCSINNIETSELELAHVSYFGIKFKL